MAATARPFNAFAAAAQPALGMGPAAIRARVEMLEMLLERAMVVPGTQYRIGLDTIVGLVPVVGDVLTGLMGVYIVWEARNLGMPKLTLLRMSANVGVDTLLGAIPLVGDAFDLVFRSNSKNLRLIKRHLDRHHPATMIIDA